MKNRSISPKAKLILATIESIEKFGLESVTTRKIADEAQMNIAAINYHFGSKENLISASLKETLKEAFVNNVEEHYADGTNFNALLGLMKETFTGVKNYPNITKAHLENRPKRKVEPNDIQQQFSHFLVDLTEKAAEGFKTKSNAESKMTTVQIISAIIFPAPMPHLFESFLKMDFNDPNDVQTYVNNLLNKFMS